MKKAAAFITGMILISVLVSSAGAAGAGQAFIDGVSQDAESGNLNVLCALPGETGAADSFEVTLDETTLPVLSVSTADEAGVAKTFYCMVDVSGSMKGRMDQAKDVLTAISADLDADEGDNMVIAAFGNGITETGFLTDPEEIAAAVADLEYTSEDTDLYSAVIHGIEFLEGQSQVNEQAALVIISDGCDDQAYGSSYEEACEAVENADLPVYTAAIILSEEDYDAALDLGSFAKQSAGGSYFPKSSETDSGPADMTAAEIGSEIAAEMNSFLYVRADLSGVTKSDSGAYTLSVTFSGDSGYVYTDSREISAGELGLAEGEADSESEPDEADTDPEPGFLETYGTLLLVIVILIAAGIIIIAVVLIARMKKSRKEEKEKRKKQEEQKRLEREERERAEQTERELAEQRERERLEQEEIARQEKEAFEALPRFPVRLVALGVKQKEYTLELVQGCEMTIGRNDKAMIVLDPQDRQLSSVHFMMFWDNGTVYVRDAGSTNGTFRNGVALGGRRTIVRPGDMLRAGSYDYRVMMQEV
ncbi:MAG: FHA domain-containing protein [Lachnospiraceae bacterium]|nr:FHA domain-containing protein [Lachnospiraceae bacterium]